MVTEYEPALRAVAPTTRLVPESAKEEASVPERGWGKIERAYGPNRVRAAVVPPAIEGPARVGVAPEDAPA
jgi:hypothetical protein